MNLLDLLRGHFALLRGQELKTLSRGNTFTIERVVRDVKNRRQKADWLVVLKPSKGKNEQSVYLSDILRTYGWIIDHQRGTWITRDAIEKAGVAQIGSNPSYIMPLIATFDDIESRPGGKAAIRFIPEGFDE